MKYHMIDTNVMIKIGKFFLKNWNMEWLSRQSICRNLSKNISFYQYKCKNHTLTVLLSAHKICESKRGITRY